MKVELICIDCGKSFMSSNVDAYLCDECLNKYLVDYYEQIRNITNVETDE